MQNKENVWLNKVIQEGKAQVKYAKPVVYYESKSSIIRVGHPALVSIMGKVQPTQPVQSWSAETGVFETEDTFYSPR